MEILRAMSQTAISHQLPNDVLVTMLLSEFGNNKYLSILETIPRDSVVNKYQSFRIAVTMIVAEFERFRIKFEVALVDQRETLPRVVRDLVKTIQYEVNTSRVSPEIESIRGLDDISKGFYNSFKLQLVNNTTLMKHLTNICNHVSFFGYGLNESKLTDTANKMIELFSIPGIDY
jgi:hypothetical protein